MEPSINEFERNHFIGSKDDGPEQPALRSSHLGHSSGNGDVKYNPALSIIRSIDDHKTVADDAVPVRFNEKDVKARFSWFGSLCLDRSV